MSFLLSRRQPPGLMTTLALSLITMSSRWVAHRMPRRSISTQSLPMKFFATPRRCFRCYSYVISFASAFAREMGLWSWLFTDTFWRYSGTSHYICTCYAKITHFSNIMMRRATKHYKYAVSTVHLLAMAAGIQGQTTADIFTWERFATLPAYPNQTHRPGCNIPADLLNEFINRYT